MKELGIAWSTGVACIVVLCVLEGSRAVAKDVVPVLPSCTAVLVNYTPPIVNSPKPVSAHLDTMPNNSFCNCTRFSNSFIVAFVLRPYPEAPAGTVMALIALSNW